MSDTDDSLLKTSTVTPKHASTVHIAITNSDFVMVFAVLKPKWDITQGLVDGMLLEEVATVSLSPIAAKQLLRQVTLAIQGFEVATSSVIPEIGNVVSAGNAIGEPKAV